MKSVIIATTLVVALGACSTSKVVRTKYSDKSMRVMIDPASIDVKNYVRLQTALVKTGNFIVLDRASGLKAIKKEQEELHRTASDRYDDAEKYAHWGKLYGVGAVIVANVQCKQAVSVWVDGEYISCLQSINMIDSNTGEVILAVEGESHSDGSPTYDYARSSDIPSWDETVEKLVAEYPKYFKSEKLHSKLVEYKQETKEESQRQKEIKVSEDLE